MPNCISYGYGFDGPSGVKAATGVRTSNQSELISRGNTRGSSLTGAGESAVHLAGFAKQQQRVSMTGSGGGGGFSGGRSSAVRQRLHAIRESRFREMVNPRALLDEVLALLGQLSDSDIPALAKCFAEAVWECVAPDGDAMQPTVGAGADVCGRIELRYACRPQMAGAAGAGWMCAVCSSRSTGLLVVLAAPPLLLNFLNNHECNPLTPTLPPSPPPHSHPPTGLPAHLPSRARPPDRMGGAGHKQGWCVLAPPHLTCLLGMIKTTLHTCTRTCA